jgi:hypothetical protein
MSKFSDVAEIYPKWHALGQQLNGLMITGKKTTKPGCPCRVIAIAASISGKPLKAVAYQQVGEKPIGNIKAAVAAEVAVLHKLKHSVLHIK